MNQLEQQVREFHRIFGLASEVEPVEHVPEDLHYLRSNLLSEEFTEWLEELENGPEDGREGVLKLTKESLDMIYVGIGTLVSIGVDVDRAFTAIHESNMSKAPKCSWCNGEGNSPVARGIGGRPCGQCGGTGRGTPIIREDGKILKSEEYTPPDLMKVIYAGR